MVKRPKEREKQTENQKDIVDKKSKNKLKKKKEGSKGVSGKQSGAEPWVLFKGGIKRVSGKQSGAELWVLFKGGIKRGKRSGTVGSL